MGGIGPGKRGEYHQNTSHDNLKQLRKCYFYKILIWEILPMGEFSADAVVAALRMLEVVSDETPHFH